MHYARQLDATISSFNFGCDAHCRGPVWDNYTPL